MLSGAFADLWGFRYFSLPIGVGVLLWVLGLDFNGVLEKRASSISVALAVVLCATAGIRDAFVLFDAYGKSGVAKVLVSGAPYLETESACLKKIEDGGFVFASGVEIFGVLVGSATGWVVKTTFFQDSKDGRAFFI